MPIMSHPITQSRPRSLAHHGQSILTLGLPLVANNLATMGMGFTDTVMAGQLGGHALAAVAIGNTLWYTAQLAGMGVLMAVSPMVAHALGANEPEKVTGLVKQSFWIALMLGMVGLFLLNQAGPFFLAVGVDPDVVPTSTSYLSAIAWGLPAILGYLCLRYMSEGMGHTRPLMYFAFLGLILNAIGNYVLMDYGSGAVMAVPGHDQRDFEFAKKYGLPIAQVVLPNDSQECSVDTQAFTEKGILTNSGKYDGLDFSSAFDAISTDLESSNHGSVATNYRLRDWGVSRQRYWGTPIPMYNLADGGEIAVPLDKLPVILPTDVEMDGIQSPIKADENWRMAELNGQVVEHETDTFDTFMESSWYHARFTCSDLDSAMLDPARADYWLPVDQYVGGIEHAILHLLYARFYHKLLRDEGLVNSSEPFKSLLCQGMVLAESFYTEDAGRKTWISPDDVTVEQDDKGRTISAVETKTGRSVISDGITKMSKSKNNGVDPQTTIDKHGADTVRLFTMFAAPPEQTLEWSDEGVSGAHRFLRKLWKMVHDHVEIGSVEDLNVDKLSDGQKDLRRKTHETIRKVSDDYGRRNTFNTAIAAVMELLNEVGKHNEKDQQTLAVRHEAFISAVLLLSPIAPHICHSLWYALGHTDSVIDASWPMLDEEALVRSTITLVLQVNGKVRGKIEVAADISREDIEKIALTDENVQRFVEGNTIRKIIVVPGRLVNIVAN